LVTRHFYFLIPAFLNYLLLFLLLVARGTVLVFVASKVKGAVGTHAL
jgi:hypothetical protein